MRAAEAAVGEDETLSAAVARGAYTLMAYKDEYEVARLYTDGRFLKRIRDTFDGDYRLRFHLAPPLFARRDPRTGHLIKRSFGGPMLAVFRTLANFRFLRGTPLDPFGYSAERRGERRLIEAYFATIDGLLGDLTAVNHATAVEIARMPERIRGFGHVKERNLEAVLKAEAALLQQYRGDAALQAAE